MAFRSDPYKRRPHSKPDRDQAERIWNDGYQAGLAECSRSFRNRNGLMAKMGTYHNARDKPYSRPVMRNRSKGRDLAFPGHEEGGEVFDRNDGARPERRLKIKEWNEVTDLLLAKERELAVFAKSPELHSQNSKDIEDAKYTIEWCKYLLYLYRNDWESGRSFEKRGWGVPVPDY